MITKDELKEHYRLVCEIRDLREEIKELQSLQQSIGAVKFGGAGGGSGNGDAIGSKLAKLNDLMEYYVLKIEERIVQQEKIEKAIETLPVTERMLMRYRYIDGLDWVNVAANLCYGWTQTHEIHGRALEMLKSEHNRIRKSDNI